MAAARRHVFVEKVLKRLFPQDPRGREKGAPPPAAPETRPKKERCRRSARLAGGGTGTPPGRRLYTVALPPEGYVPAPAQPEPEPQPEPEAPSCADSADSEGSSSGQDAADQEPLDQPKRRRIRKHKSKKRTCRPGSSLPAGEVQSEVQGRPREERPQPQGADGPAISKNKKRKLKKKQQVKRKRAAGLLTKAAGLSFLYVPNEGDSEPGDSSEGAGGGSDAEDPAGAGDKEGRGDGVDAQQDRGDSVDAQQNRGDGVDAEQDQGDSVDAQQDRGDSVDAEQDRGDSVDAEQDRGDSVDAQQDDAQAKGVLDFLKSTQEMYFYDAVSRGADPAFLAASEALLGGLAAGSVPPSDLRALGYMKALLLLQDRGALRGALQAFEEHCALPPDQARVVSAFFSYWLTHILPEAPESEPGAAPESWPSPEA